MPRTFAHRRTGMTLIELLVVIAIIGLLAVTVLPTLANTTESRRTREAARVVSSFVAKGQSRSIGRTEWSGLALVPPNATAPFAIDLFLSGVPQVYRGESLTAAATVSGAGSLTRVLTVIDSSSTIPAARLVATGDPIRFDGRGPWYELIVSGAGAYNVRLRGSLGGSSHATEQSGQSERNTPWPTLDPAQHSFEILRQPRITGSPFTIPDGRCVDLSCSGYGGADIATTTNTYTTFGSFGTGVPVHILFDATGRVRQVVIGGARMTVTGALFLLVGRPDRAGQAFDVNAKPVEGSDSLGANWQYADSFWIGIDPASGIVKTAECYPGAQSLIASQQFIRSEMPAGGR